MIAHKHITKIIAVVMAAAVCLCLCAAAFSHQITVAAGDTGISMEYETALFDTDSIISVNIRMDEADWNEMLANATAEEYYQCDVEINGTTFYRVGIRPKGNTSLTSIASDPTTDRCSFKLEFDHYVDGQTCFGLDKLVLNNNYADATSVVNDAIEGAFSGTTFFDTLLEDETYHGQYYAYLQQLVSEYINGGGFDAFYERIRSQIDAMVETDPTAFYSYEEYLTAADTLYQVVKLRGQSIQGQLNGTIPSTDEEQRESDALVDASSLDISVMGSMNTGGGGFDFERQAAPSDAANDPFSDSEPSKSGGPLPDGLDASQSDGEGPEGFDPSQFGGKNQAASDSTQRPANDAPNSDAAASGGGQTVPMENLALYGLTLLVMIAAMLFAVLYRRKPRGR